MSGRGFLSYYVVVGWAPDPGMAASPNFACLPRVTATIPYYTILYPTHLVQEQLRRGQAEAAVAVAGGDLVLAALHALQQIVEHAEQVLKAGRGGVRQGGAG